MEFTRDQVLKIAELGRLALTDAEVAKMSRELTTILGFFEELSAIPTEGVEPMAHPLPMENVFREDVRQGELTTDEALANAPKRVGDFFAVPAILD